MDLCLEETAFICRAAVYTTRSGSCSLTRFLSFLERSKFLQFLLRFTKARGFEDKNIVSTLDGSYYMENNCVHGQHHPHTFIDTSYLPLLPPEKES